MQVSFINEIILIIIAAFIGGFVARSIKLPPVVGYIVSGVIFGFFGKNFITSYDVLFQLSEIGIALLLFTLGFAISFKSIKKINKKILIAGVSQIVLTALITFPFLLFLNFSLQLSLLFALVFSFSSTAVVVKILEEKGMLNNFPGNNVFIFLLIQDLFVVPAILLFPFIFGDGSFTSGSIFNLLLGLVKPLVIFIGIFILSKYFLSKLLNILFRYPSQELTLLATIFIAVLSIGLLTAVGLPSAIAAFFAGILISEEGKNLAPLAAIRPLRDIFLVMFFVLTGMLVDVTFMAQNFPIILSVTVLIIVIKFGVITALLRTLNFLPSSNIFISSHLSNIGEFSVVIAQIALVQNFITQESYGTLLSIFILSLIAIPFVIKYSQKIGTKSKDNTVFRLLFGKGQNSHRGSFEGLAGHVVICGHGRVGKAVRTLLEMGEVEYVVVDFDRGTVENLIDSNKRALHGDPSDQEILRSANVDKASILVVAVPDSLSQRTIIKSALVLNPKITILCRSHVDGDKYELVNLGVNTIVVPEFEAGVRLGREVLGFLGFSHSDKTELLKKLRKFHLVQ